MKKFIKVFAVFAVVFSLILSAAGVVIFKVVGGDIDYGVDEALFEATKVGNTATYFAYSDGELCEVFRDSLGAARAWASIEDIPGVLVRGFVAVEDRDFYKHNGVNVVRSLMAIANYFLHFRSDFGASTVTQQVVKNISGDNQYSIKRKIAEMKRATRLEKNHTKDEIMEVYLNILPMSGNIYGIREAALEFFGKEPIEMTVSECATLIGITNAPTRYNPYTNADACKRKRDTVLRVMRDEGVISENEYINAVAEEITLVKSVPKGESIASWFIETAREDIISDIAFKYSISRKAATLLLYSDTRTILTMNPRVQEILENQLEARENLSAAFDEGLQYAMVVTDNETGDLVGIVGRAGEKQGNRLMNLALAPHPPASTIKPLSIYAELIESGDIAWSTIVMDNPTKIEVDGEDIVMYPRNSPDIYEGDMTVKDALKFSKNTIAVSLYGLLGGEAIFDSLTEKFGFDTLVRAAAAEGGKISDVAPAPLALGQLTQGVSLISLTEAYGTFPNGGVLRNARSYYGVFSRDGKVLVENNKTEKSVYSKTTAEIMTKMLEEVVDGGTARSIQLKNTVDTAGKTGTSAGDKDRLFVGFTPYYTAGIWTGYPDNSRSVGSQNPSHLAIWDTVMQQIHEACVKDGEENLKGFSTDATVKRLYCRSSGVIASDRCPLDEVEIGYYSPDSAPAFECPIHGKRESIR